MADIALGQLLHTAGDNTLSQTDGALHGYMRGTDGTATRTIKTDANGNITISPDSGLGTEATLAALATLLTSLDGKVATATKQDAARVLLASLDDKDFATQTTLAAVLAKLADPATATKQDAAKGVLDAISTAVATRATEATLAMIKDALTDGTQKVQLSGSLVEARSSEQIIWPRAARTANTSDSNITIPTWAKGVLVMAQVWGATGVFGANEGLSLAALGRFNGTDNIRGWSTNVATARAVRHVLVYPGATADATDTNNVTSSAVLPTVLNVRMMISGTFQAGEGFDCECRLVWLR